MQNLV